MIFRDVGLNDLGVSELLGNLLSILVAASLDIT